MDCSGKLVGRKRKRLKHVNETITFFSLSKILRWFLILNSCFKKKKFIDAKTTKEAA